MKTHDEIKKAVSLCILSEYCETCPYYEDASCSTMLMLDVFACIEQLESHVEPKNRVLTLEEARNAEVDTFGTAMHWLELKIHPCKVQCEEIRCAVLAVSIFFEDQSEDGEPDAVYSYADRHDEWLIQQEYGKRWRCWLRKPNKEEMEGTPWEK